jgi:FKBP-type peptidyl-prolyl cis-trans isomerase 2
MVWVSELGGESAVLDANHPLAGNNLVFDIELFTVQPKEA